MGKKLNKVYDALLEGVARGHRDRDLYEFVMAECPKTSSKRIVKASMLALTDPDIRDRTVLEAIYALAITYRLSSLGVDDDAPEVDDDDAGTPTVSAEMKTRLATSAAKLEVLSAEGNSEAVPPPQLQH